MDSFSPFIPLSHFCVITCSIWPGFGDGDFDGENTEDEIIDDAVNIVNPNPGSGPPLPPDFGPVDIPGRPPGAVETGGGGADSVGNGESPLDTTEETPVSGTLVIDTC